MSNTNDNPPGNSRRRVLKTLGLMGAGAALLPEKWVQPIVNSVIEPAEATCLGANSVQQAGCPQGIPIPRTTILPTTTPVGTTTPSPTTTATPTTTLE